MSDIDGFYEVTLTIPSMPGQTHREAAETFVRVLRDWMAGGLDMLTLDVKDEYGDGIERQVEIRAAAVEDREHTVESDADATR